MKDLHHDHVERLIDRVWSLSDYLEYLNRDCSISSPSSFSLGLTTDLCHWAECGVVSARDLANYAADLQREINTIEIYDEIGFN